MLTRAKEADLRSFAFYQADEGEPDAGGSRAGAIEVCDRAGPGARFHPSPPVVPPGLDLDLHPAGADGVGRAPLNNRPADRHTKSDAALEEVRWRLEVVDESRV